MGGRWSEATLAPVIETIARFAASTDERIEACHLPPAIDDPESLQRAARRLWTSLLDVDDDRFQMGGEHYLKALQLDREAQAEALGTAVCRDTAAVRRGMATVCRDTAAVRRDTAVEHRVTASRAAP